MPNVFNAQDVSQLIDRINRLTLATRGQWGKMSVGQMLAHCNVAYELVYQNTHPRPNPFMKFLLKAFVKDTVVGKKPYRKNAPTAPAFKMVAEKDFETEKKRLIDHLRQTLDLGAEHFHNRESHSFGKLSEGQWNIMFYKHLDHHLTQFGV